MIYEKKIEKNWSIIIIKKTFLTLRRPIVKYM